MPLKFLGKHIIHRISKHTIVVNVEVSSVYKSDLWSKELCIFVRKGEGESVLKLIQSVNSGFFYSCFSLDTGQSTKLRTVLLFCVSLTNPVTLLIVSNSSIFSKE